MDDNINTILAGEARKDRARVVRVEAKHVQRQGRMRLDGKFFARGGKPFRFKGVTYGPFASNTNVEPYPAPDAVAEDFAAMNRGEINAIRTYHVPPEWLLQLADDHNVAVLIDVPWSKHLCFLHSDKVRRETREQVRRAADLGRRHSAVIAYSIGNEIPPNIVRWHGARRIERFLAELMDVCKQVDPDGLVTYGNYPSTEYLDLSFLDFATFNVYLHDRAAFCRYLVRLQNLVGDKPLVLGELGMDTFRHGEITQARYLAARVREASLLGLAGTFVFSWTDDWHTGGHTVTDWAFGITHRDRVPKASYHTLREVFERSPTALLGQTPRVSVIVCSYNGAETLEDCIRSLTTLDYPNYEVIVVDDGSTDNTRAILERYPRVRAIHQANQGLSAARNAGFQAATGSIIAYTDSDCFADPNWLTQLVYQFQNTDAAAVGGPNLPPEDGRLAACVAASPGQPTHVLESDQVAEHIPGCNMAFRREALEAINGFDSLYRKAGDDVDVCWRLQQAGYWITFAPGAFVWHHRRQNVGAYLRQQIGYGEAEALLRFKHPAKFNGRGDGKWRGVLYGNSLQGLRFNDALIYRGTFGTGLFQCVYQPAPAHWAMLPSTLEWHVGLGLAAFTTLFWPWTWGIIAAMLGISGVVAVLQAAQAEVPPRHRGFRSRLAIALLCYLQPLVRSWSRYHTRIFAYRPPTTNARLLESERKRLPLTGRRTVAYWSEEGGERTELLGRLIRYLNEQSWGKAVDTGWSDWDVEIYCHPWTVVQVCTAEENHGQNKRLIRVRYRLRPTDYTNALTVAGLATGVLATIFYAWVPAVISGVCLATVAGMWSRGTIRASQALEICDVVAVHMNLHPISEPMQTRHPTWRQRLQHLFRHRQGPAS
jgi:GT2 family glycosyltransferase